MDLVDDENLYDKDHNSNSEHNKNERCDEYLNEKNKNRSDSGTKTKTSESSKAKSRTGDITHLINFVCENTCCIANVAIVLDDFLRYKIFNEEKPHYKIF